MFGNNHLNTNNRGKKMNAAYKYDIMKSYDDMEYQEELLMIKSLSEINVYDLGGIDHYVILKRNSQFGFDLEIENEEDHTTYQDHGIHPYAIESLATFCRRFLHGYELMMDKE